MESLSLSGGRSLDLTVLHGVRVDLGGFPHGSLIHDQQHVEVVHIVHPDSHEHRPGLRGVPPVGE